MGIPKQFNDVIESQLNIFAAWLPVTNNYQLGDYGIIADGVFAKMGNIKEFGISFTPGQGKPASIDFTSASTKVINFAAGAQVDVIPEGAIDAKVTFHFENAKSFLVKSPAINVSTIDNVNEIGTALINNPKWDKKFKVVYQTYLAKDVAIMSTIDAGTEITFTGDVKALQAVKVGNVSVGFSATKKLGLSINGTEGIIGLGLFQIVSGGFLGLGSDKIKILTDETAGEQFGVYVVNSKEIEDDL